METAYREQFNRHFRREHYAAFLQELTAGYPPSPVHFAETPVFIPPALKHKLAEAGETIIRFIRRPGFRELTEKAIPAAWHVPGENDHPHFLSLDFGICTGPDGELTPKLIELQGFPSLYGLQLHLAETHIRAYGPAIPPGQTPFFNGMNREQYIGLLKKVILGPCAAAEVALMDIDAPQQKTAIDFYIMQHWLGLPVLSLTDIFQEGRQLFYLQEGKKIRLKRIYNRLIFDEVSQRQDLFRQHFDPREPLDITWITHPNWFYRISKFLLPLLRSGFVPETHFLHKLKAIPADLENYVLKPLFSFAGSGVQLHVTPESLAAVRNPEEWILQRKVTYAPAVASPEGPVKAEIRLMYLWPDGGEPILSMNMVRLSRGEMIGVRFNENLHWTGGSAGLMDT